MTLIESILSNKQVVSAITLLILSYTGYLVSKINKWKSIQEIETHNNTENLKSLKRSSLRNEYLQVFNCTQFTYEQKYGLTRVIIQKYRELDGNSYIDTLDQELKERMEDEVRQQGL